MGLRRAGKTSAREVVFHRLPPKQAFFVDTTPGVVKEDVEFWVPLQLWEIPGSQGLEALEAEGAHLSHFSSLIWVIDAADDYTESLRALFRTVVSAHQQNPSLHIDVFAHKSDAWDEYYRQDAFRQIQDRTINELEDHPSPRVQELAESIQFHLTSVYDHSVFEAMSRVVQRLVPTLGFLEQTLNYWSQTLDIPKCFLFDVPSRLYITTDASPVDPPSHDVCCQYIENIESVSQLFQRSMLERRKARKKKVAYRSSCSSKIAGDNTVAYWQISERLALVALVQTHMFDDHRGAIEMNVKSLRDAMLKFEALEARKRRPRPPVAPANANASSKSDSSSLRTPSVHASSAGNPNGG
ncbi:hypothetical protein CALVIDRAFT_552846 [Calocera viscosa TUFC12733]|uniref:GTP-binding protein n=1 Tax=Calocera viscosa (strain TUFC12733) TaxID=1330018 RepID=A0A167R7A1_CALVF|nr:hypothetical protein CALVIDRAFT_552846 [Calocera viscosa TUFC12733]